MITAMLQLADKCKPSYRLHEWFLCMAKHVTHFGTMADGGGTWPTPSLDNIVNDLF